MKICWDNLEKLRYKNGYWYTGYNIKYIYKDSCKNCCEPFLTQNTKGLFCSNSCAQSKENHNIYGRYRSKETKNKISTSLKGKLPWNAGKNLSEKHKTKLSDSNKDKNKGRNNGNWNGGISCEPYCDIWLDKDFKESIKERDGYQCLNPVCSKESEKLNIHHINYIKKDCKPLNLITLCISCNAKANFDRVWHQSWYNAIIYNRYSRR